MIKIDENTIKNPITFIGKQAGVAYGSDISDNEKNCPDCPCRTAVASGSGTRPPIQPLWCDVLQP